MTVAASYKRTFLAALGHPITIDGQSLRVMPDLAEVAALDESTIADAIGHRGKATRIATASRAVAQIGEDFLRTAPYEAARDALLEISGIGPFAAAAILLRGLGRMDELPWMPQFERAAEALYGSAVGEATITRRYGRHIGYWSFYVMTGVGRRTRALH
jgi:DNA-3-methyladenine glycosylase II